MEFAVMKLQYCPGPETFARNSRISLLTENTHYLPHSSSVSRSTAAQEIIKLTQQSVRKRLPFTK
jgi:hypothetical protein